MKDLSSTLHPIESKVLASLKGNEWLEFGQIVSLTGLHPDQVRRALAWLSSKELVEIKETTRTALRFEGKTPPELILMDAIERAGRPMTLEEMKGAVGSDQEFSAALGRARSAGWIRMETAGSVTTAKAADSVGPSRLRAFLLAVTNGTGEGLLPQIQPKIVQDLLKRGVLTETSDKTITVRATRSGESAPTIAEGEYIERITPEVLSSGAWKGKKLRPLDVSAKAPRFYPGRRHPVHDFIKEVREAYVSMGFTEVDGSSVQPAFWNFDALFIPQNHPGREMQDTFYLKGLSDTTITRSGVVGQVASTHENGWRTGSKGWGYKWQIEEARRLLLRTHNTVLTIRALAESGERETRVFAVSKVYRNENLDYKHLAEFHQMDGIIVGEGLSVRNLMGFLKEFYKKLGMKDVKFWPTFFPYTEPSLEVVGYSEAAKDWIELSGSGVFRPEVTRPIGVKVPVLAWGPGIERLMLFRYGLEDMRSLYDGDLSWLRSRVEIASSSA